MLVLDRSDRRALILPAIALAVFSATLAVSGLIDLGAMLHDLTCRTHR